MLHEPFLHVRIGFREIFRDGFLGAAEDEQRAGGLAGRNGIRLLAKSSTTS
ncbi:MAG: hypothetical protein K2Y23_21265 [Cyanobacteria bacterium]|nr:hypothetical protein [Cyanobacteriota bacterium]